MSNAVSLVTGAAGALGSAVVRVLASAGQRIALVDLPRARKRLDEVASDVGGASLVAPLDLTQPNEWSKALERVESELGPITGAALIAGGWQGGAPFHAPGGADPYSAMLQVNLETVRCSLQALLPGMTARGKGSIVVVGSRVVERPWEGASAAAYTASKAAVVALAQAVAGEVLARGVRVNAVLPSIIDTHANRQAMPKADHSTWVSPTSLANVIRFLLSDDARDISGAAIPVYGRV